jgi:hypothetical protein
MKNTNVTIARANQFAFAGGAAATRSGVARVIETMSSILVWKSDQ